MSVDYAAILRNFGYSETHDSLSDTATAFCYEINGVLFSDDSPFDIEQSDTRIQPDNLNKLVICTLYRKPGYTLSASIHYLLTTWYDWLRYMSPKLEHIEIKSFSQSASVRVLSLSQGSACTIQFLLKSSENSATKE